MKTGSVDTAIYTAQAVTTTRTDGESEAVAKAESEQENTDKIAINWKEWEEQQKEKEQLFVANYSDIAAKYKVSTSKPSDSSAQLTRRLAAASGDYEVQMVIAKAGSDMIGLRMIAAMGEGDDKAKALQYLRKLEKLVDRASGKLKDLRNEAGLEQQRARAQKQKAERRAEEIKSELRQRRRQRKNKEDGWLREAAKDEMLGAAQAGAAAVNPADRLSTAAEAEIAVEAEAIAAAEMAAASVGGGADFAGGDIAASGGGEAAAAEAPVADAGGSVDISV